MTIGQTLKLIRTAANLKQSKLAELLGVTPNYISLIENDRREPSLSFLKKFADCVDAPLGYFLFVALNKEGGSQVEEVKNRMNDLLSLLVNRHHDGRTVTQES